MEVPQYLSREMLLQKRENRMFLFTIDVNFGKQRETSLFVSTSELSNACLFPRLLSTKVIARESENSESQRFILIVELDECLVPLVSESTPTGHIDD